MLFKWKDMEDERVKLYIYLSGPKYNDDKLQAEFGETANDIKLYLSMFDSETLAQQVDKKGQMTFEINEKKIVLKRGEHFWTDLAD